MTRRRLGTHSPSAGLSLQILKGECPIEAIGSQKYIIGEKRHPQIGSDKFTDVGNEDEVKVLFFQSRVVHHAWNCSQDPFPNELA